MSRLARAETRDEAIARAFEERDRLRKERIDREIDSRIELWSECQRNPEARSYALSVASDRPIWFIDNWIWTHDPRNAGTELPTKVPFVLRPKQRELVEWLQGLLEDTANGLIEKSRDEGGSFVCLAFGLHHWLFRDGFSMSVGSRKLELVDEKGDLDALIPKVRFMLYNLPSWMRPDGFVPDQHDNFTRLINPETDARITGEAGENMGRGGRSTFYLIDEWAFVKQQQAVNAAVVDNAKVHCKLSTPSGQGGKMQQEKRSGRYRVFTLHWKDNPVKNFTAVVEGEGTIYPWYEKRKRETDEATLAQEVEIDYGAATENVVIPSKWVRAAVEADYSGMESARAGLDVADKGDDSVYTCFRPPEVTRHEGLRGGIGGQADQVERLCRTDGVNILYYDRMGVGSGMTATLKQKEDEMPFRVVGVSNADTPTSRQFDDRPEVPAYERFSNFAAELWWALRMRFWNTYLREREGKEIPITDCISIPDDPNLVGECSQPTWSKNAKDKIVVDKFGVSNESPDHAESLMYANGTSPKGDYSSISAVKAMVN